MAAANSGATVEPLTHSARWRAKGASGPEAAASQPGVALFSRGRMMDQLAGLGVPNESLLASDGLHHNDRGYACIAEALARSLVAGMAPAR